MKKVRVVLGADLVMKVDEIVSRATHVSGRTLLALAAAMLIAKSYGVVPSELPIIGALGTEDKPFSSQDFFTIARWLISFLCLAHLSNLWVDFRSFASIQKHKLREAWLAEHFTAKLNTEKFNEVNDHDKIRAFLSQEALTDAQVGFNSWPDRMPLLLWIVPLHLILPVGAGGFAVLTLGAP